MKRSLVYGIHAVEALIKRNCEQVDEICVYGESRNRRLKGLIAECQRVGLSIRRVERSHLDTLSGEERHQDVVALLNSTAAEKLPLEQWLDSLNIPPFVLILDGVEDPHNLGAALRSADAAGVQAVIIPNDRSAQLTGVVRRVASGAAEALPLYRVKNLVRTIKLLKQRGIWVIGAAEEGEEALYSVDLEGPLAVVLGSEGRGLRRLTREQCDRLINIPMAGSVSSLNVSVAAGIILYEAVRQRNHLE